MIANDEGFRFRTSRAESAYSGIDIFNQYSMPVFPHVHALDRADVDAI